MSSSAVFLHLYAYATISTISVAFRFGSVYPCIHDYRLYLHINRPTYKLTIIPTAKNLAKISDLRIGR